MTIADEIRTATSQNRLHPLVRDNWASPRGLCNCHTMVFDVAREPAVVFCKRDFGHEGGHINGPDKWESPWPPPQLDTRVRTVIEAIANRQTDTLEAEFICNNCGAQVYFQREPGPCPQCGKAQRITEGTSDVS